MWKKSASEFILALRGKQSQKTLSRRLGYKGNPVRDWEAGRRFPTARETIRIANVCGINIYAAFEKFHCRSARHLQNPDDWAIDHWLNELRGATSFAALAERSGQSPYAVRRWLKGESQPRLPDFFKLIDTITGRSSDLVALFVDIKKVPTMRELHVKREKAKNLAFHEPWTEAVMRLLETESYRALPAHDSHWLSQKLDISLEKVTRCIELLLEAGVIQQNANRLQPSKPFTVYTGADQSKVLQLKTHWAKYTAERLQDSKESDWFAYNVMSVSKKDLDVIEQIMKNAFHSIRSIVAASEPEENVALLQMQLINWVEKES